MNGSVKGVSSGIVDEIFDGAFEDSKDTVDCFRGAFDKVNGGDFSVGTEIVNLFVYMIWIVCTTGFIINPMLFNQFI